MLQAVVLQLQALEDGVIQGSTGRAVHGFWFEQWQRCLPAKAAALHNQTGIKPFTLSPLMGLPFAQKGVTTVTAGSQVWLRLTSLQEALSHMLLEIWLPQLPPRITLAETTWLVQRVALTSAEHRLAGKTTYASLHASPLQRPQKLPYTWSIEFKTPTAFRNGKRSFLPFPLPNVLLTSWHRRWQAFAPIPIKESLCRHWRDGVFVSAYNLKTVPVRHGRRLTIGCVGKFTLRAPDLSPAERAAITTLVDYAFFAGSGYHTTQGMGMTW